MFGKGLTLTVLPGLLYYAFVFFCVWKFWQTVCRIDDNLAGIRQVINRIPQKPPGE